MELLLEGRMLLDRIGYFYANKLEVGPMFRFRFLDSWYSLDLISGFIVGYYLGRAEIDPLPKERTYRNWQSLLVLGATF